MDINTHERRKEREPMKYLAIQHIATYPYRYHIHVMTGGEYAGDGAFCKNLQEVVGFMNAHEITEWKYI